MFVGHYGVGLAIKKSEPGIPLWVLFIAVQFLDVLWAPFVLLGIEKVRIVPGITASSPLDLYYMPFTHSLPGALGWSALAFLLYRMIRPRNTVRAALLVGAAVFSHWVLDLVVHRPDLPLYDNHAKVGFGLWNLPVVAFALEALILFAGAALYLRTRPPRRLAVIIFCILMLGIQASVFFGPPPSSDRAIAITALASYALFAAVIAWLERGRRVPARSGTPAWSPQ
jgi:membrane-bound metal-dependent hydrolase YbcI (DUF457 family)